MLISDPGHIYLLESYRNKKHRTVRFVKRSGGAVTYAKEWFGIQTQAVMRAMINHIEMIQVDPDYRCVYPLWQLGSDDPQDLFIESMDVLQELHDVLDDRSRYLNTILFCVETSDACSWLQQSKLDLLDQDYDSSLHAVRMSLWCYEARAYRRKQEEVNRKHPTHDDGARLRSWRCNQADDVPFNEIEIEKRPIGKDGHIVLTKEDVHES